MSVDARRLAALILFLAAAAPALAQAPPSLGSAAGLAGTAVTGARRADAALWNPALVGIYDGPQRTTSLFAIHAATLPRGRAFDAASRLGLLTGRAEDDRLGFLAGPILWGSGRAVADVQVRWAAVQSRDLAISLDTRFATSAALPQCLAGALGVHGVAQETWQDASSSRSLTSVLTVARGAYLGEVPVFGRVWIGTAAKGWWVHQFATGAFHADLPAADVYRETALGKVGGLGLDAGVAGRTAGRIWYGIAVSNAFETSFRPASGPRTRSVAAVETDGGELEFAESWSAPIADDDPDADAVARARALWDGTRFPSVLRAGVAWESGVGAVSAAVSERLGHGGLDPSGVEPERSFGWSDSEERFRVAYGWGTEHSVLSAAVSGGGCNRRWTAGVRRSSDGAYGVSIDLSLSDWSCNLHGQGR